MTERTNHEIAEALLGDIHTACLAVGQPCAICRNTLEAAERLYTLAALMDPTP